MRFIVSFFWAFLIGAAISYVLTSMGNEPFNWTQSITFTTIIFVGILVVDFALGISKMTKE